MQLAGYIEILEQRIRTLERVIDQIRREPGRAQEIAQDAYATEPLIPDEIVTNPPPQPAESPDTEFSLPANTNDQETPEEEDLSHVSLAEEMKKFTMNASVDVRYFGEASVLEFSKRLNDIKYSITGMQPEPELKSYRISSYWGIHPWELHCVTPSEASYIFPEDDLLEKLVSLYFEKTNILIPVLHRPTFMKSLFIGQHHWDASFGMIVLMVCALGSKYCSDPRVLINDGTLHLSAGWKYFSQVPVHRWATLSNASIYDLQYFCLAGQYLYSTSLPHTSWSVFGMGLRHAIELGLHRRNAHNEPPSAEKELRKRVFWSLVCLERILSSLYGRPCAYQDEIFDVEYPIACDDEYWIMDDPRKAFQQPDGKPCTITAFIRLIRLCEVLSVVLRTLYSNKKSKTMSGYVGVDWEARMIAALDSAMIEWKDNLPDYHIQIHRRHITEELVATASFEKCTSAAIQCARVLEVGLARGLCIFPTTALSAYMAGGILVLDKLKKIKSSVRVDEVLGEESHDYNTCGTKQGDSVYNLMQSVILVSDSLTERGRFERPLQLSYKNPQHVYEPSLSRHLTTNDSTTAHVLPDLSFPISNNWEIQDLALTEMGYTQYTTYGEANEVDDANVQYSLLSYPPFHIPNQFQGQSIYTAQSNDGSASNADWGNGMPNILG
ncbi:Thiamine repressible genes regulatory protein thi1 [Psilocybe cubensis]|uniref:Thiamine repressible genes regulatory protein thi1 n=1 Tax=Psilocybe cubensis TaxID=181762 RepID=A0ACB8H1Y9_PSICU|nr:Thiamine repressible genes regulatory protein thi1 [Psilocybe cubensis]KAH9481205.1 Thiamine repressible genes regulatory protein thi1 [Psilocybe cubensis]